ncbi:hypothetical protein [Ramlibacter alkalitolerans]|uniref:Uncharacterized protein n=1 Tax=Ramlibacter alkalitolerans TaxID=2039631 RepID=A0ABS1JPF5_9BURK|nr:hypothetical protein [Ramlibacter alkalitolerans]MBL0425415.1 hypothetical protein [Ramlibacter alkalitolerans]
MPTRRASQSASVSTIISAAEQQGLLFDGELGPPSAGEATGSSDGVWSIRSLVPRAALSLFLGEERPCVMTSDALGLGDDSYWVIGYQVADTQHRFVLPLVGAQVAEMLESVSSKGIVLQLRADGIETQHHARLDVSRELAAALRAKHTHDTSPATVLPAMLLTTAGLLRPQSLRPAHGTPIPKNVSVTGVLPLDVWS